MRLQAKVEFNKLVDSLCSNQQTVEKALSSANERYYLGLESVQPKRKFTSASKNHVAITCAITAASLLTPARNMIGRTAHVLRSPARQRCTGTRPRLCHGNSSRSDCSQGCEQTGSQASGSRHMLFFFALPLHVLAGPSSLHLCPPLLPPPLPRKILCSECPASPSPFTLCFRCPYRHRKTARPTQDRQTDREPCSAF